MSRPGMWVCLLVASHVPLANADDRGDYNARAVASLAGLFRTLDRNFDGRLTRAEVMGDLNMEPRFDDLDGNRDGVITLQELEDYVTLRYGVARRP